MVQPYISLPCAKQQREMTKSALSREREPRRIIFKIYIFSFTLCSIFILELVLTERNKQNATKEYRETR